MDDDPAIDELFTTPLNEFIARRDALAKSLRASGSTSAAAEIKSVRKPSAPVWAVNQVARRNSGLVGDLLSAGESVRTAQSTALSGGVGADLRSAMRAERDAVGKVAEAAVAVLRDAGLGTTPANLDRITSTLHAAAVGDEETRELLRQGRLTVELDPPDFGVVGGLARTEPRTQTHEPEDDEAAQRKAAAEHEAATAKAAKEAERLERRAEQAADEADRLERRAQEASERAAEARDAADEARRAADEARRQAEDLSQ